MIWIVAVALVVLVVVLVVRWVAGFTAGLVAAPSPGRYLAGWAMVPALILAGIGALVALANLAGFVASPTLAEAGRAGSAAAFTGACLLVAWGLYRMGRTASTQQPLTPVGPETVTVYHHQPQQTPPLPDGTASGYAGRR